MDNMGEKKYLFTPDSPENMEIVNDHIFIGPLYRKNLLFVSAVVFMSFFLLVLFAISFPNYFNVKLLGLAFVLCSSLVAMRNNPPARQAGTVLLILRMFLYMFGTVMVMVFLMTYSIYANGWLFLLWGVLYIPLIDYIPIVSARRKLVTIIRMTLFPLCIFYIVQMRELFPLNGHP